MRHIFSLFALSVLTISAVVFFRSSLHQALVEVDIEELALYSDTKEPPHSSQVPDTTLDTSTDTSSEGNREETDTRTHRLPTFAELGSINIQTEISTPPPLTRPSQSAIGTLSIPGVLAATNAERQAQGASPLILNTTLSQAAAAKLAHMFEHQYFEHVGPDGSTPASWVDAAGYAYKLTGENLALGHFSGDSDLVSAWMNSPGHRANILKADFTEIGVAVGKGMFDGRETWLAVQIFGRPLPNCLVPAAETKATIVAQQSQLKSMQTNLSQKQQELDMYEPKAGSAYKEQVDAYNALVTEYNAIVQNTEELIEAYNASVNAYNSCMAQ